MARTEHASGALKSINKSVKRIKCASQQKYKYIQNICNQNKEQRARARAPKEVQNLWSGGEKTVQRASKDDTSAYAQECCTPHSRSHTQSQPTTIWAAQARSHTCARRDAAVWYFLLLSFIALKWTFINMTIDFAYLFIIIVVSSLRYRVCASFRWLISVAGQWKLIVLMTLDASVIGFFGACFVCGGRTMPEPSRMCINRPSDTTRPGEQTAKLLLCSRSVRPINTMHVRTFAHDLCKCTHDTRPH